MPVSALIARRLSVSGFAEYPINRTVPVAESRLSRWRAVS